MTDKEFDILLEELDKDSKYFHEDTCSATYKRSTSLHDIITFRDSDEDNVIEFFNKFIEYRNLKIIKIDDK